MTGPVNLAVVGRTLEAVLSDAGVTLLLRDKATSEVLTPPLDAAGHMDGLLPVFLVAGDAVWQEATGRGFSLRVKLDPLALLGYRVDAIGAGTFSEVLLATMEAVEQAGRVPGQPGHLMVNDLYGAVWQAARDRADLAAAPPAPPTAPASPGPGTHP